MKQRCMPIFRPIALPILAVSLLMLIAGIPNWASGQFTNEFTIGEYAEFYSNDSIKVYFNCTGKICRKSCASFYRTGTIDKERISVTGKFRDYYLNDSVAFEGSMDSGYLHGRATSYFSNGQVKSTGYYKKGQRTGLWRFFYQNGSQMQILNYVENFPFVNHWFNPRGRLMVKDGVGKYRSEYNTYRSCEPMEFRGKVIDGLLDGKVKIYSSHYRGIIGYEYYNRGKFMKGVSGSYNYSDYPKIELPGYLVHEQLMMDENTIYCPGFLGTGFMQYDKNLYWRFYTDLLDSIHKNINYLVEDQWLAIGLSVSFTDDLFDVNVFSSKDDYRLEKDLFNIIIDMNKWESAQVFWRKINSDLFFTILITKGRVIIPAELTRQAGGF